MKKKLFIFPYIISVFLAFFIIVNNMIDNGANDVKIVLNFCFLYLFLYLGSLFLYKYNNKDVTKKTFVMGFILYLILLFFFLFFSGNWIRGTNLNLVEEKANLVPFKTIKYYISKFDSDLGLPVLTNLLGNFFALMPFAVFLPILFEKQRKFKNYFFTILVIVIFVEFGEMLTLNGIFDVDDMLLNFSGAILLYVSIRWSKIYLIIENVFLLKKNKIEKKVLIKSVLIVLIYIVFFGGISLYAKRLYDINVENRDYYNNPTMEFIYNNECSNENNLFYETKLYKYYFNCYNNNEFYVLLNGKDKLHIKDYIGNNKYNGSLNTLLFYLKINNIDYFYEHNYTYDILELPLNGIFNNEKNEYVEVISYPLKVNEDSVTYEINFVPLKKGKTEIVLFLLNYDNGEEKIIGKYKYDIIIDSSLNLQYKLIK